MTREGCFSISEKKTGVHAKGCQAALGASMPEHTVAYFTCADFRAAAGRRRVSAEIGVNRTETNRAQEERKRPETLGILLADYSGGVGVAGSNPAAPTSTLSPCGYKTIYAIVAKSHKS